MSQRVSLKAELRTAGGKGAARRLRRTGAVPGVVYFGGKEATSISVQPLDLSRALTTDWRRNALIEMDIAGVGKKTVMLKDLQKDPVMRTPTHADFVEVTDDTRIVVQIPFVPTGRSKAVQEGGKLELPLRTLKCRCLPEKIPATIGLDTSELNWGAHRASLLTLPEGVDLLIDPTLTIATITRPRGTTETDEETPAADAPAAEAPAAT
jgi:large subunit ribosomal protein L25